MSKTKSIILQVVIAAAIITAYSLRVFFTSSLTAILLRSGIYTVMFLVWGVSVNRRVIHPQIRRLFSAIALLMCFWMIVRTVKFVFSNDIVVTTYLWYLYYIPLLFIPLLSSFISTFLGRPESFRLPKWTNVFYAMAAMLALLVLTNDFHQLVFKFYMIDGVKNINVEGYTYSVGFIFVSIWQGCGLLATLAIIYARSFMPKSKYRQISPLIPAVLLVTYCICYIFRVPIIFNGFNDMTVIECLLMICILENCLRCGLIQSNTHYGELFGISDVKALIVDKNYSNSIESEQYIPISVETLKQARSEPVLLEGNIRLSSSPIKNGYVFWQEDISEICQLLDKLSDVNDRLSEDNDLLMAEQEMKERQARVAEKERLYDKVTKEILSQLKTLDELLFNKNEVTVRDKMKILCFYGTYIKRRTNLLIMREDNENCSAKELEYCVRESCEALSASGVNCSFNREFCGSISIKKAILMYDIIEEALEAVLPSLTALFLKMTVNCGDVSIKILADSNENIKFSKAVIGQLKSVGGEYSITREEECVSVAIIACERNDRK